MTAKVAKLKDEIERLKKERNAVILAHNYQPEEVQDIADYLGDSLELSRKASRTEADVIVFCGVHFMTETAAVLCPDKKVIMPDLNAGCPMADMITPEGIETLKEEHPEALAVCYVNTSAAVKAHCDVCCTSSNAIEVVESLQSAPEIIFVPDKHLTHYVSAATDRRLISWAGYCPVHVMILAQDVIKQKKLHPNAEVLVHPECTPDVIALADKALSTSQMCEYAKKTQSMEMIIGTEVGLLHKLRKENPKKAFYPASEMAVCPNMKLITQEKVLWSLQDLKYEINVPEDIRVKAKKAIDRMLEVGVRR